MPVLEKGAEMKDKIKKICKSKIFSLVFVILFVAVCFGIGASIAYIQHESDPTEIVVSYFRAFVQGDYEKMYQCLYKEDNDYIDKKLYMEKMEKLRSGYIIDSYDIGKVQEKDGRDCIVVKCKDAASEKTKEFVVYVESKHDNSIFIPTYYVDISDMLVTALKVTIPDGDTLQLNETNAEKYADIETKDSSKIISFNRILVGSYKISATNNTYALNKSISIKKDNISVDMQKVTPTANSKYEKLINSTNDKIVSQFYKAVRNRNPKKKELLNIFSKKNTKKQIQKMVKESQDIVYPPDDKYSSSYKVRSMKIYDEKNTISYDKNKRQYKSVLKYSYDYTSSNDTSLASSYIYSVSGTCNSTMTIVYTANKDKMTIVNIKIKNKDKK